MHDDETLKPTAPSGSDDHATPAGPADPGVWRETTIEATPEEIWELLDSDEGRDAWLEPDADRTIEVVTEVAPERVVWRWQTEGREDHRVEVILVPESTQTRVIVIESAPYLPVGSVATSAPTANFPLVSLAAAATGAHSHRLGHRWTLALA